jgi:hypothetical protein
MSFIRAEHYRPDGDVRELCLPITVCAGCRSAAQSVRVEVELVWAPPLKRRHRSARRSRGSLNDLFSFLFILFFSLSTRHFQRHAFLQLCSLRKHEPCHRIGASFVLGKTAQPTRGGTFGREPRKSALQQLLYPSTIRWHPLKTDLIGIAIKRGQVAPLLFRNSLT